MQNFRYLVGDEPLVGGGREGVEIWWGWGIFAGGGNEQIFSWSEGDSPHPPVEKTLYIIVNITLKTRLATSLLLPNANLVSYLLLRINHLLSL